MSNIIEKIKIILLSIISILGFVFEESLLLGSVALLGPIITFVVYNLVFIFFSILAYDIFSKNLEEGIIGKFRLWIEKEMYETPLWIKNYIESGKIVFLFLSSFIVGPIIVSGFLYLLNYNKKHAIILIILINLFMFAIIILINMGILRTFIK